MTVKKGDILELEIQGLAYGGKGTVLLEEKTILIPDVVPGDRIKARIQRIHSPLAEAALEELVQPSPLRTSPRCPHFPLCGGCSWQCLSYDKQLVFKEQILTQLLSHLELPHPQPIIPSPEQWHYRNKMEFTFAADEQGEVILGLHATGKFYRIINIRECHIHPPEFNQVLELVRTFARPHRIPPYNPQNHQGILRHLVLRKSITRNQLLITLITASEDIPQVPALVQELKDTFPQLKGFLWGLNTSVSDVAQIEKLLLLEGEPFIEEQLEDLVFKVSASSFFQPNTRAAAVLYPLVRESLALSGKEHLFDAYCGIGTFAIFCASRAARAFGIEIVRDAVWDARFNAHQNKLSNCLFLVGKMRETLPLLLNYLGGEPIQRVVIDPPRGGMDKKSLNAILSLHAPVFVYISCNPISLAHDLKVITQQGYQVKSIQPIDFFPHTYHLETVVTLHLP